MSLMPLLAASGRQLPVHSDCLCFSTSGLGSRAIQPQLAGIVFLSFQRMKKKWITTTQEKRKQRMPFNSINH